MILMLAPGPNMSFGAMPSGAAYTSDQFGLLKITNSSAADQVALAKIGCATLTPIFGGFAAGQIDTLANLYTGDATNGLILPNQVGFPRYTAIGIYNDGANTGTWAKTGAGTGAGNWTQISTSTVLTIAAAAAASAALAAKYLNAFPNYYKGDPGGNVMAIGLFTGANTLNIPLGTDLVQTSGYSVKGVGQARYRAYDANPGLPASAQFQTANGRWFGIAVQGEIHLEQVGGMADCPNVDFNYQGSLMTNAWTVPAGVTDNWPALRDAYAVVSLGVSTAQTRNQGGGSLIPIRAVAIAGGTNAYFFSQTIAFPAMCLRGTASPLSQFGMGTTFRFPPNTAGILCDIGYGPDANGNYTPSAAGSIIDGIYFAGGGGTDRTKHGFQQRVPVFISNCVFDSFSGNNTHNVASASLPRTNPGFGLTSASSWINITCQWAGNWNTYAAGSDISASTVLRLQHNGSRLGGLYDTGYFVNTYPGYQNNGHGYGFAGACWLNGRRYFLCDPTPGIGATTQPGTNDKVWEDYGPLAAASRSYPAWSASATYEMSVPVYTTGAAFIGHYIEDYYLPVYQALFLPGGNGPTIAIGGSPPKAKRATHLYALPSGGIATRCPLHSFTMFSPANPDGDTMHRRTVGDLTGNIIDAWARDSEQSGQYGWSLTYNGPDIRFGYALPGQGYPTIYNFTGYNTTKTFGGSMPQKFTMEMIQLAIGNPENSYDSRRVQYRSALPTSGDWAQGTIIFNNNAGPGGYAGWYCVTSGTFGTATPPVFKAFGLIST